MTYQEECLKRIREEMEKNYFNQNHLSTSSEYKDFVRDVCPQECGNLDGEKKKEWHIHHINNCVKYSSDADRFFRLMRTVIEKERVNFGKKKDEFVKKTEKFVEDNYDGVVLLDYSKKWGDSSRYFYSEIVKECLEESDFPRVEKKWLTIAKQKCEERRADEKKHNEEFANKRAKEAKEKADAISKQEENSRKIANLEEKLNEAIERIEKLELENQEFRTRFQTQQDQPPK